jgi:hypothetical protein
MSDAVRGALVAARDYLRVCANPDVTYGYFHGGDPRDFCPDPEVCTPEELAAHKAACEAWERGERPELDVHRHEVVEYKGKPALASYAGAFGMGTYQYRDEDAEDVLEQIEAALASLGES